jgi:chemotaxis protein MotB
MENGLPPERMSVQGLSEYHPVADNSTAEGRNRNRRVVLVVLAGVDDHHVSELATHQTHAAAETAIPANSVAAATAIPSSSTP